MTLWYVVTVPRHGRCQTCNGHGVIADDPDDRYMGGARVTCAACGGSKRSGEITWEPNSDPWKLYADPGTARGVIRARRRHAGLGNSEDGKHFRILVVDTDLAEPLDDRWDIDRQFELATERALFWAERALKLQPSAALGLRKRGGAEAITVAHDAILTGRMDEARAILAGATPEKPALSPENWRVVRLVLANAVAAAAAFVPWERAAAPVALCPEDAAHARGLLASLDACAAIEQMHREGAARAAETVEATAAWAAGHGPRRCWRDVTRIRTAVGMSGTACGDSVPLQATTLVRSEVACAGCERALGPVA